MPSLNVAGKLLSTLYHIFANQVMHGIYLCQLQPISSYHIVVQCPINLLYRIAYTREVQSSTENIISFIYLHNQPDHNGVIYLFINDRVIRRDRTSFSNSSSRFTAACRSGGPATDVNPLPLASVILPYTHNEYTD